jgi:hypothetical protein
VSWAFEIEVLCLQGLVELQVWFNASAARHRMKGSMTDLELDERY